MGRTIGLARDDDIDLETGGQLQVSSTQGRMSAFGTIFIAEARVERRLAAILAAASSDVNSIKAAALAVTFARLMSVLDERRAGFALLHGDAITANALCLLTSTTGPHFVAAVI